jgi:hypothetical protein
MENRVDEPSKLNCILFHKLCALLVKNYAEQNVLRISPVMYNILCTFSFKKNEM